MVKDAGIVSEETAAKVIAKAIEQGVAWAVAVMSAKWAAVDIHLGVHDARRERLNRALDHGLRVVQQARRASHEAAFQNNVTVGYEAYRRTILNAVDDFDNVARAIEQAREAEAKEAAR